MSTTTDDNAHTADLLAIADTMYRFGQGIDENDGDLLNSVFTDDAVVDIARSLGTSGHTFPVLEGRPMVVGGFQQGPGQLRTSHLVHNIRPRLDGDGARVRAVVQAMHIVPDDDDRRCQTTSVYDMLVRRGDEGWCVARMDVDVVWYTGDLAVITGG